MTITEQIGLLSQMAPILAKKNCWSCCDSCKKKWSQTGTEYVHKTTRYIITDAGKKPATRFVCDTCLPVLKSKQKSKAQ